MRENLRLSLRIDSGKLIRDKIKIIRDLLKV